ncbi:hypothetical protein Nmel_015234 [Mimus melanotis]
MHPVAVFTGRSCQGATSPESKQHLTSRSHSSNTSHRMSHCIM